MLAKLLDKLDKLNAVFIKRLDEVGDIKQTFNQQWSNQNKRSCSTYHSFNVFLAAGMLSIFSCLCFFLAFAVLQKQCQGNFKNLGRVGLALLKKLFFEYFKMTA